MALHIVGHGFVSRRKINRIAIVFCFLHNGLFLNILIAELRQFQKFSANDIINIFFVRLKKQVKLFNKGERKRLIIFVCIGRDSKRVH